MEPLRDSDGLLSGGCGAAYEAQSEGETIVFLSFGGDGGGIRTARIALLSGKDER